MHNCDVPASNGNFNLLLCFSLFFWFFFLFSVFEYCRKYEMIAERCYFQLYETLCSPLIVSALLSFVSDMRPKSIDWSEWPFQIVAQRICGQLEEIYLRRHFATILIKVIWLHMWPLHTKNPLPFTVTGRAHPSHTKSKLKIITRLLRLD